MEKVKIGFIGLGQRGAGYNMTDGSIGLLGNVLNNAEDVVVTALCDKYQERLDAASAKVVAKGQPAPMQTKDYRDLLNKDIVDGIIISTSWDMHVQVALEVSTIVGNSLIATKKRVRLFSLWKIAVTTRTKRSSLRSLETVKWAKSRTAKVITRTI